MPFLLILVINVISTTDVFEKKPILFLYLSSQHDKSYDPYMLTSCPNDWPSSAYYKINK